MTPSPPTDTSTLSLHDALPISAVLARLVVTPVDDPALRVRVDAVGVQLDVEAFPLEDRLDQLVEADPDRKSTRLNSSHLVISYAVFCLKKKIKRRTK